MAPVRSAALRLAAAPRHATPGPGDLALLAMLLGVHALPVIGFGLSSAWGEGAAAYGAVVVFLTARELVRELLLRNRSTSTRGT